MGKLLEGLVTMENRKVLILTLCGNKNYGNRLQNYALSCIIEKFNYLC